MDLHPVAPTPQEATTLLRVDENATTSKSVSKRAGFIALGALIWSWVLQAEASQAVQADFNKPFFIVCFNHTAPVVLLPLLVCYFKFTDDHGNLSLLETLQRRSVIPFPKLWRDAIFLSSFYAVTDYFWYAALANVSVAVGTAIFNCSPLFVYCFSICFLHERLSFAKMCGVLTSFVGVTLVVIFQDSSDLNAIEDTSVLAGLMVVLSAALYGAYEVAIRLTVGEDITDTVTLLIMTGLCGLFTIPLWLVGSFFLAYGPIEAIHEPLGFPDSTYGVIMLLATGVMAIVFCVFLPLSLCWTSPLETSVGCMLTIPLSGVVDTVVHNTSFSWQCITSLNYQRPFFIMCFSHAAPVMMIPFIFAFYRIFGGPEDRYAGFDVVGVLQRHSVIPFPKLCRLATFFGAFYVVSDYFWFSSFKHLTVAAGAAIFNSSPLFVYCFSICLLHEKASIKKLFGVLTAFAGVLLVVMYQEDSDPSNLINSSVIAGLMMLTAATMTAGFQVMLARFVGNGMNDISTLLIFNGLCGIIAIPMWFIGSIFFANSPFPSAYEPFGFPDTTEGVFLLTFAVVMFVINFICLTISICLTSPLETSVGFMLTIPLSGVMDILIHHTYFSWQFIVGSALVMTGFGILEFNSMKSAHGIERDDTV
ncbi:hypothetical protein PHYBOEH_001702 [Phytophthora boehmeriae]|uniref:EamA domain-containing protein n=1 Tax=Phytophthora boehmeriae TaxID=109152 RepID=A0A8T1WVM3_9STRA|nr:hypothetical protein PHYBOEH_001702 [Phytophthora boehmeriae]